VIHTYYYNILLQYFRKEYTNHN